MPYRSELKRPDLKGQFPCSVCGKIFCHSSSLSRHRMQAHFKSYTCSQCNQEISSSETLRSHMFRIHQISRMFMCRCCNWAFADKTSLHIHMQSMVKNNGPGDVYVLARSSTEQGTFKMDMTSDNESINSISSSPMDARESSPAEGLEAKSLMNISTESLGLDLAKSAILGSDRGAVNSLTQSIFPALQERSDLFMSMKPPQVERSSNIQELFSQNWLNSWLANNPLQPNLFDVSNPSLMNLGKLSSLPVSGQRPEGSATADNGPISLLKQIKRDISINTESNEDTSDSGKSDTLENSPCKSSPSFLDSLLNKKISGHGTSVEDFVSSLTKTNKRKARKPQQLKDTENISGADCDGEPKAKIANLTTFVEGIKSKMSKSCQLENHEQHSPAISDSHTCESTQNNSSTHSSNYECTHCKDSQDKIVGLQEENEKVLRKLSQIESGVFQFHKAIKELKDNEMPEETKMQMLSLVEHCVEMYKEDESSESDETLKSEPSIDKIIEHNMPEAYVGSFNLLYNRMNLANLKKWARLESTNAEEEKPDNSAKTIQIKIKHLKHPRNGLSTNGLSILRYYRIKEIDDKYANSMPNYDECTKKIRDNFVSSRSGLDVKMEKLLKSNTAITSRTITDYFIFITQLYLKHGPKLKNMLVHLNPDEKEKAQDIITRFAIRDTEKGLTRAQRMDSISLERLAYVVPPQMLLLTAAKLVSVTKTYTDLKRGSHKVHWTIISPGTIVMIPPKFRYLFQWAVAIYQTGLSIHWVNIRTIPKHYVIKKLYRNFCKITILLDDVMAGDYLIDTKYRYSNFCGIIEYNQTNDGTVASLTKEIIDSITTSPFFEFVKGDVLRFEKDDYFANVLADRDHADHYGKKVEEDSGVIRRLLPLHDLVFDLEVPEIKPYIEEKMKVFVVTGANKGIGLAIICNLLNKVKNTLIYLTARSEDRGTRAVACIYKKFNLQLPYGNILKFHQLDITDKESIEGFISHLNENNQTIHILVNNAGFAFEEGDPTPPLVQAHQTIAVNYYGTKLVTQLLNPMVNNGGKIIFICSSAAKMPQYFSPELISLFDNDSYNMETIDKFIQDYVNYCEPDTRKINGYPLSSYRTSKAAEIAMAIFYSRELANREIKVFACCPGPCKTDLSRHKGHLSIYKGSKTPVYCAIDPNAPDGKFLYLKRVEEWLR
uniref:C2H2-type domain-containing protein n=1 Tax=Rhabditophanes sp. KR3021 TaxID=114890 RepID=A0AC35U7E5_9BILA